MSHPHSPSLLHGHVPTASLGYVPRGLVAVEREARLRPVHPVTPTTHEVGKVVSGVVDRRKAMGFGSQPETKE